MKTVIEPVIRFKEFSKRQMQAFTWWCKESPYSGYNGIIADGSIRAGKTVSMAISFVLWAMTGRTLPCVVRPLVRSAGMCGTGCDRFCMPVGMKYRNLERAIQSLSIMGELPITFIYSEDGTNHRKT